MKLNCEQCGTDIERHIFCSRKCKDKFHNGAPTGAENIPKGKIDIGITEEEQQVFIPNIKHSLKCSCGVCKNNK
jgi:hypothetical protein